MSKQANKRLQKEYASLAKAPPPFVLARPYESNLLECHFVLRGPEESPYAGGEYHGVLLFTPNYPFAPPGIKMFTPSGRFQPDRKLCTSFSDFHQGSWNPSWSVSTILTGLLSFMLSDEMTTGSVRTSDSDKRVLASSSHGWNLSIFPEYAQAEMRELPNMGQFDKGVPEGPPLLAQLGNPDASGTADDSVAVAVPSANLPTLSLNQKSHLAVPESITAKAAQQAPSSSRRIVYGITALVAAALFMRIVGG